MIIKNVKIVTLNRVIENGYLILEDGVIKKVGQDSQELDRYDLDLKHKIVMPGFIDIHTHGGSNYDFMKASKEEIKIIANDYYKEGITSFLATTLTSDEKSLSEACKRIAEAKKEVPSLLGIHLEGPFINVKYKGAQNPEYIVCPDINMMSRLIKDSNGLIKNITMAPENEGSDEFIRYCVKNNVNISLGHSNATFNEAIHAFDLGAGSITHAHNAMSGYHHRNPGLLEAAMYYNNKVYSEVISDLVHVHEETIKTYFKIIGSDHFMIITDSLSVKNSSTHYFDLFGLECEQRSDAAYLKDTTTLAGSILHFDQGVRNIYKTTGCSLIDLMKISSYNQSQLLKQNHIGLIKKGYQADLVILNEDLSLYMTIKNGNIVYQKEVK